MAHASTDNSATANTSGLPAQRDMRFAKTAKPASIIARTDMKHQRKTYCGLLPVLTQAEKRQNCQDYDDSADEINNVVHDAVSIDDCPTTQLERHWFHIDTAKHCPSDRLPMLMHVSPGCVKFLPISRNTFAGRTL